MTTNRYAIASVPLNSLLEKRKVVFSESVGLMEGYSTGRGIELDELQNVINIAMIVGKEVVEAADIEVERIQQSN